MKTILIIKSLLIFAITFSQVDTSHFINVNFLYGSKPIRKYKSTESKYFGGNYGGHVTIECDGIDYCSKPTTNRVHIITRKSRKSNFVVNRFYGQIKYGKDNKTVIFIIPLTTNQHLQINKILKII